LVCYFAWINDRLKEINHRQDLTLLVDSATIVQAIKSNVRGDYDDSLLYMKSLVGSKNLPLAQMIELEKDEGRLTGDLYKKARIGDDFKKKAYPFPRYITK